MQASAHENMYRTTTICVDSNQRHTQQGRLYNPFWEGAVAYEGVTQFLVYMEKLLDDMNFPQAYQTTRSFFSQEERVAPICAEHTLFLPEEKATPICAERTQLRGQLATFVVKILFRQHASWQGSILWVEAEWEEDFRSALELVLLMNSAVESRTR